MGLPVAQGLYATFEAEIPNRKISFFGRLRHQLPNTVVSNEVHQDFFSNHFRCLAPQHIHTHGRFDVTEKQLDIPALEIEIGNLGCGVLNGIQQRGDNVKVLNPEARIGDRYPDLPQG